MKLQEPDTKQIQCPHLSDAKHKATLYCYPHKKYAGIWECQYGYSESHEHDPKYYEIAEAESWPSGPHEDITTSKVYICGGKDGCGVAIEGVYPDA